MPLRRASTVAPTASARAAAASADAVTDGGEEAPAAESGEEEIVDALQRGFRRLQAGWCDAESQRLGNVDRMQAGLVHGQRGVEISARPVGLDNSAAQLATAAALRDRFGLWFPLIHASAEALLTICRSTKSESYMTLTVHHLENSRSQRVLWLLEELGDQAYLSTAAASLARALYALDRLAKIWVLANLTPGVPVDVIGDVVRFILTDNPGAAFSLGSGSTWVASTKPTEGSPEAVPSPGLSASVMRRRTVTRASVSMR